MLGRLEMTLDECEAAYTKISEKVFDRWATTKGAEFIAHGSLYSSSTFESELKAIIEKKLHNKDARMYAADQKCKVYVAPRRVVPLTR